MLKFLIVVCLSFLCASWSFAHNRIESYSSWRISQEDGTQYTRIDGDVTLSKKLLDALNIEKKPDFYYLYMKEQLNQGLDWSAAGERCFSIDSSGAISIRQREGHISGQMSLQCFGKPQLLSFSYKGLFRDLVGHKHIAHVIDVNNNTHSRIFSDGVGLWDVNWVTTEHSGSFEDKQNDYLAYVDYGFGHAISGIDHMVFIFLLVLASLHWRGLVLRIGLFTAGHFLSILLVSFSNWQAKIEIVEMAIGFSIAYAAAIEIDRFFGKRSRVAVFLSLALLVSTAFVLIWDSSWTAITFLFGLSLFLLSLESLRSNTAKSTGLSSTLSDSTVLIFGLLHGLGFASALRDVSLTGWPLFNSVVSFNIGVELGQLLFVGLLILVFGVLKQVISQSYYRGVMLAGVSTAYALGCYWWFIRLAH